MKRQQCLLALTCCLLVFTQFDAALGKKAGKGAVLLSSMVSVPATY